jgi:FkbM family methyltransferase
LRTGLKDILARLGLDVRRRRSTLEGERQAMLARGEVGLVIDVGAHLGEYAKVLRRDGYRGEIVSFEPVATHFETLAATAAADPGWRCVHAGVGAERDTATINVSGNAGFSSSLLKMNEAHERAVRESRYSRSEETVVVTLDEELGALASPGYLKIDTQGYEHAVLAGAPSTLRGCKAVELELSLRTLYDGQLLIGEMIELMRDSGFVPTHIASEFVDPNSGELLQVNCLFLRSAADPAPGRR